MGWLNKTGMPLQQALLKFSFYPLPGQFALICAVSVIAFTLRQVMFY
jgi:biotin transport system substrate-specific component